MRRVRNISAMVLALALTVLGGGSASLTRPTLAHADQSTPITPPAPPACNIASDPISQCFSPSLGQALANYYTSGNTNTPLPSYTITTNSLYLQNAGITDLNGIQRFTNLTNLTLSNNAYSGSPTTPNSLTDLTPLSALTNLTSFAASSANIHSLNGLQNLTQLSTLNLDNQSDTNRNTFTDLSPLTNLTSLRTISINNYSYIGPMQPGQIQNLQPLSGLTNLTNLSLTGNQISNISPLNSLSKLTYLTLDNNKISSLAPLQNLITLQILSVNNIAGFGINNSSSNNVNRITDLSPLSELTNLQSLSIGNGGIGYDKAVYGYDPNKPGNQISNLTPLQNLTKLTNLNLYGNRVISDLTPLANLSNLTALSIFTNNISSIAPLQHLTKLTLLYADGNHLGDDAYQYIKDMPQLNTFGIGDQITDISPLTNLNIQSLYIVGNHNISDMRLLARNIGKFPSLRNLYLTDNNIDNAGLNTIIQEGDFSNLNSIGFDYNQITDITPIFQNQAKLSHLTRLQVSGQFIRLPDKPDYDEHSPMSLGPTTVNNTVNPHQIALEDTSKPSTPTTGKSFDATTGIITWGKTMPGDHQYNFNYQNTIVTSPTTNLTIAYSGTIAQRVPGIIVSFDPNGGSPTPDDQAHHQNDKVTPPVQVNKPNWYLDGWYNPNTGTKWDFDNDTVTADITLKAHWKAFVPMTMPTAGAIPLARLGGITILSSSAGALALFLLLPQRRRGEHARQSYSFGRGKE
ncbi:hypothetical protein KIM372_02230 [Bombiscardovia nodaiensis]|uniref:Uncharacterized protein n=1 Tax=Bombiscardovia nodaiensis TaxID=2932181 RepID=A0ABN6S7W7_9BIFI|nr:hypothetical protein KIM372_02230 [Bombiscardovia nodaiensis]